METEAIICDLPGNLASAAPLTYDQLLQGWPTPAPLMTDPLESKLATYDLIDGDGLKPQLTLDSSVVDNCVNHGLMHSLSHCLNCVIPCALPTGKDKGVNPLEVGLEIFVEIITEVLRTSLRMRICFGETK